MNVPSQILVAGLLVLVVGGALAEVPTPIEVAQNALDQAMKKRRDLEKELIRAYRMLEADFERVRGPEGAKLREALAELVTETASSTPGGPEFQETVARALVNRLGTSDLLSATVADRFARAVAQQIARFKAEPGPATATALDEIFAKDNVDDIWDAQFIDLPVVVLWREANVDVELRQLEIDRLRESDSPEVPPPPDMVLIPGGSFVFGPHVPPGWPTERDGSESPKLLKLPPYYIDVHEVTNKAYLAFLHDWPEDERAASTPAGWRGDPPTFPTGKELSPVTYITFAQASAFAAWSKKRLPTEREWEKAARGALLAEEKKAPRLWPWGPTFDKDADRDALVWAQNRAAGPARICSRLRDLSPFGVLDMAGNVAEWTTTHWTGNRDIRLRDIPKLKPTDQLVIRGGSFKTKEYMKTRVTYRWVLNGTSGAEPDVGFRCVLDAAEWRKRRRDKK